MSYSFVIGDENPETITPLIAELESRGYKVFSGKDGPSTLEMVLEGNADALIIDSVLSGLGGKELVLKLFSRYPGFPVFVRTSHTSLSDAFDLAQLGVLDYSTEDMPVSEYVDKIVPLLQNTLQQLPASSNSSLDVESGHTNYVTRNTRMTELFETAIERVAKAPSTVLITGESGTGKELLARSIHQNSLRADGPWVAVNCSALPESLIESELFGHEKGAFTGAASKRTGRFELANHGTLFLDEIGDLSPYVQTKLLRVLQERTIERVGGTKPIPIDVRFITATHRNLKQLIKRKKFREDLFYRISVINLELPPLRERPEDILGLATFFVERFRKQMGRDEMVIMPQAAACLGTYPWHGNVRELENVIERAVVLAPTNKITAKDLPDEIQKASGVRLDKISLRDAKSRFESDFITQALIEMQGNVSATASRLKLARKNLQEKIKRYKIDVDSIRKQSEPPEESAEDV